MSNKEIKSYLLRLPKDIFNKIEKEAEKNKRSFNNEIFFRLEKSLETKDNK